MYLLIFINLAMYSLTTIFTSHYVSINSAVCFVAGTVVPAFTSHYVSINSTTKHKLIFTAIRFTSHYVSINSNMNMYIESYQIYLHPTMYLLIHIKTKDEYVYYKFTSHYVSINSSLLSAPYMAAMRFTSHYVSINSSLQ